MGQASRFESIDNFTNFLNKTKTDLDTFFVTLQGKTQEEVDIACVKVSSILSSYLNKKRDKLVNVLHYKYTTLTAQSALLQLIASANPTDLGSVISVVKNMITLYTTPYTEVLAALAAFTTQITALTSAINSILTYTPPAQTNINFNAFNLDIGSIAMEDVISGTTQDTDIDWNSIFNTTA